jgi:hypothetical protein
MVLLYFIVVYNCIMPLYEGSTLQEYNRTEKIHGCFCITNHIMAFPIVTPHHTREEKFPLRGKECYEHLRACVVFCLK